MTLKGGTSRFALDKLPELPLQTYINDFGASFALDQVMNTYSICLECRRRLLAKARRIRPGQWPFRAHFISLNKPRCSTDDLTEDILSIADTKNTERGSPKLLQQNLNDKTGKTKSRDLLESLFKEGRFSLPIGKASPQDASLSELHGHLEKLKWLLNNKKEPIENIWAFFLSKLHPNAWGHNGIPLSSPLAYNNAVSKLLRKVNSAKKGSYVAGKLPSSSEIMALYTSMGMQPLGEWNVMLWDMIQKYCERKTNATQPEKTTTGESLLKSNLPQLGYIAEDLLGAWEFICKTYGGAGTAPNDLSKDHITTPRARITKQYGAEDDLAKAFLSLFPRYPLNHLSSISSTALAAFAVLIQHSLLEDGSRIKEHPFMVAINKILNDTGASKAEIRRLLQQSPNGIILLNSAKIDWSSILQKNADRIIMPAKEESRIRYQITRPLIFSSTLTHKQLGRAMIERDLLKVNQLWEDIRSHSKVKNSYDHSELSTSIVNQPMTVTNTLKDGSVMSPELFNHFILTYMGLRQPNRAIDVWNYMLEKDVHPTLSTWNAMLEGCKLARSLTSLENVWVKLQASNVKPDMLCWTTRISGLVECGKPDLAIRALIEMGSIWLQAANRGNITNYQRAGDIDGIVKPTIQTINAAISGLLRRQNMGDAVNSILSWGGTLGVQPDIITFNTLLRSLVRNGPPEGVQALLSQMQKANVQADVATFTTLLEEMFKTSEAQSPAEQEKVVNHVFSEMEAAGIEANLYTYGKIIYSLLQSSPSDMTVVRAVMARMAAKGVEPSTYIYTILIKHHFSRETPDVEAVRLILERIRLSGTVMDHIFWDRVIEGYARLGDTAAALSILGRVDRPGSKVGWPALQRVLIALAKNGEWDFARQVVRNAWTDRGAPPKPDEKGVEGQHNFWSTVADLGLMHS